MKIIVNKSYDTEHLCFAMDSYKLLGAGDDELTV